MREFDLDLATELASEVTTLCRCWTVARKDGVVLGFTDHDLPLSFDEVAFEPETGFARTEMEQTLGLGVDNVEASGALRSEAITETDIARGLYDGAVITQWVVDYRDVERRAKLSVGRAGEIRRGVGAFEMEVLGQAELLNRSSGRIYQRLCDADLGDERCGVDLSGSMNKTGTVEAVQDARRFVVGGNAAGEEAGFFSAGRLEWTSGANAGATATVRAFYAQSGQRVIDLWNTPEAAIELGDGFRVYAGCDKTATTCRAKFANFANFRGFPMIPGEDWLTAYPRSDEDHNGGSLFDG